MTRQRQIAMYAAAVALGALDFTAPYLGRSTFTQANVIIGMRPPEVWPVAAHVLAREAFLLGGIAAIFRRPRNRTGYLMVGVGLSWMVPDVGFVPGSLAYTISELSTGAYGVLLIHLALAFPTGRLANRADRIVMGVTYGLAIPNAIGGLPFYDPHVTCFLCAGNPILVRHDPGVENLVDVHDDGVGGADATAGSGLRGLEDRVAALDGALRIESEPGHGTRIVAEIPCG